MKTLWRYFKKFSEVVATIQSAVILTIFYVVLLGPIALLIRLFSDTFNQNERHSLWRKPRVSVERMTKQF